MIRVRHLLEAAEADDGQRIWAEPIGLTRDLREWCKVDHVMPHLGPPAVLREWFSEHPDGYDYFRGRYHETLVNGSYRAALQQLACAGVTQNITLLHDGEDAEHNTATALHEFLSELEAYCRPEGETGKTKSKKKSE